VAKRSNPVLEALSRSLRQGAALCRDRADL